MLSIPVMEGIVFVYIFKAISFAGCLNEYSQFACLQQLINSLLFIRECERVFSQQSVGCNLKALGMQPYQISCVQESLPPDFDRRIKYCQRVHKFVVDCGMVGFNDIFYSDEA